jgi:diguanylate cyclase (GGDEF)-like protein
MAEEKIDNAPRDERLRALLDAISLENQELDARIAEHTGQAQKILDSEIRFRSLFNDLPFSSLIFDLEGRPKMTNQAFKDLWSTNAEDVRIWLSSYNILEDPQVDNFGLRRYVEKAFRGERVVIPVHRYQPRIPGKPAMTPKWLRTYAYPIFDQNSSLREIVVLQEDITDRIESERSLAYRLAIEEVTSSISSLFIGLQKVSDSIQAAMSKLGVIAGADRAYTLLFQENPWQIKASFEWSKDTENTVAPRFHAADPTQFKWAFEKLLDNETLQITSLGDLPPEAAFERSFLIDAGISSLILMPLFINESLVGCIGLDNVFENDFWEKGYINLLRVISETIGSALLREQVQLTEAHARRQAETLHQALAALTSELDMDQVLQLLLVYLEKVIPHDSASVLMFEDSVVKIVACRGFDPNLNPVGNCYSAENQLVQEMLETKKPIVINDTLEDPRFKGWAGTKAVRSWLGVPMLSRGEMIGFLTLDSIQVDAFSSEEARTAQTFASEAAIAVANARYFDQIQQLARTDPLTGLFNRRHFFEIARKEFSRATRYDVPLTMIMLDIDFFKSFNDAFGHDAGDQALVEVANCIQKIIRETDVPARYGGEEFAVLLPQTDLEGGLEAARKMREAIEKHLIKLPLGVENITVSLGVAAHHPSQKKVEDLLKETDQALYRAKAYGRNQVQS